MSKNVAVFVDVASIFYAAKAAGVDIDYVTLLKAATAGRDFVRAYAYTGLDPDNDNQRQFHAFLARSGYKVISKDIRKYGDGRIKANLDIELVVDMMKTARNLDIAVVVSGDGDFASAIRAVQEMGVRVEVISFRGNTSSDLIDAADLFTDISQVARVEKGSARSGRRVAAEGDLSMTEVPEKETEGAPRRRRGRATEERAAAAAAAAERETQPANLVALPGERLSRVAEGDGVAEAEAEEGIEGQPGAAGGHGLERHTRLVRAPAAAATPTAAAPAPSPAIVAKSVWTAGAGLDGLVRGFNRDLCLRRVALADARQALAGQHDHVGGMNFRLNRGRGGALALLGRSAAPATRRALCLLLGYFGHRQIAFGGNAPATAGRALLDARHLGDIGELVGSVDQVGRRVAAEADDLDAHAHFLDGADGGREVAIARHDDGDVEVARGLHEVDHELDVKVGLDPAIAVLADVLADDLVAAPRQEGVKLALVVVLGVQPGVCVGAHEVAPGGGRFE